MQLQQIHFSNTIDILGPQVLRVLGVNTPSQPYCGSSSVSARAELKVLALLCKRYLGLGVVLDEFSGGSPAQLRHWRVQ